MAAAPTYSAAFEAAFAFVVGAEGGYSSDPKDSGNWTGGRVNSGTCKGTKFGISAASFPLLDIVDLTELQAKALYSAHYWAPICGDQLPPEMALVVFDCAVNQGVHAAVIALQESVGADPDGWVGAQTIAEAKTVPLPAAMIELCARRAVGYASAREISVDGLGWYRRLFRVAAQAQAKD